MNLLRAITTVGSFTMLSRVFGFVRDMLIAAFLGAGFVADVFFVAFKLPNLFRRLFAEGAFAAAFVPLYAGKLKADGAESANAFAERVLSVLFVSALLCVVIFELGAPWIMQVLVLGFVDDPDKFATAVELSRITFPYLLFISLVSLFAGILNSIGRFAAAAAAPVWLNVCLIAALLFALHLFPTQAHALSWAVFAAGVVQLIWMAAALVRNGVRLGIVRPSLTSDVKQLFTRALPVALGAGVYQLSLVIDMMIASLLPEGSFSFLNYADRVNQLPLGVVGVAVGTALLPLLSSQLRAGDDAAASHSQNRAIEFALLLTVPATIALAVIAEPIVRVLFERGAFTPDATTATAGALAVYAIGLPAYVLIKALTPNFFARGDTKAPVVISCIALTVNLVLNLILMGPFLHVGIAMATSASAWLNCLLLIVILRRRGHFRVDSRLASRLPRTLAAAAGMGGALWFAMPALATWTAGDDTQMRIAGLVVLVALGLAVFGILALGAGAARISDLRQLRRPAQSG